MELDSTNIKRIKNIYWHYIINNWRILSIQFIALTYLFGAFCYMTLFFSYNVRIAVKPLSYFIIILITIGIYLLYVIINHLIVRHVISHRILLVYDILALIMLICIMVSDSWVENRYINIPNYMLLTYLR